MPVNGGWGLVTRSAVSSQLSAISYEQFAEC
jgi:hypothetical protein